MELPPGVQCDHRMKALVQAIHFKTLVSAGIFLLALFSLIALGFWQLERATQKKDMIDALKTQRNQAPLKLDPESKNLQNLLYRRVQVSGAFDFRHQLLQDNRVQDGRAGVYVYTPLLIDGTKQAILINRGWMPMSNRQIDIADLEIKNTVVSLAGRLNHFPGVGFKFDGGEVPAADWPALVQWIDPDTLAEALGYRVLPLQILLDPDFEPGFLRRWDLRPTIGPEKHRAYAFQWFALAALLAGLGIARKVRGHAR